MNAPMHNPPPTPDPQEALIDRHLAEFSACLDRLRAMIQAGNMPAAQSAASQCTAILERIKPLAGSLAADSNSRTRLAEIAKRHAELAMGLTLRKNEAAQQLKRLGRGSSALKAYRQG